MEVRNVLLKAWNMLEGLGSLMSPDCSEEVIWTRPRAQSIQAGRNSRKAVCRAGEPRMTEAEGSSVEQGPGHAVWQRQMVAFSLC